jgi:hypothetical protein
VAIDVIVSIAAGFHVFPTFLRSEFSMILGVTFCVLVVKVCPVGFR